MNLPLLHTSSAIEAALGEFGRTEDVKFSPSGGRLAVAAYQPNRLWVMELAERWLDGVEGMAITQLTCIESKDLCSPHGLCWLDEHHIVVANREAAVQVFAAEPPDGPPSVQRLVARSLQTLDLGLVERKSSPGSIALFKLGPNLHELIVCNNYVNLVSHHIIGGPDASGRHWSSAGAILSRHELDIPDGVTVSRDNRWIAISNHGTGKVFIHENTPELMPDTPPCGVLTGVLYPHGLCFSADGNLLLVADAGQPFLQVFRAGLCGWRGAIQVDQRIQVLDQEDFEQEHVDVAEGGPKGIDVRDDGLLVLTCKAMPVAFHRLPGVGDLRSVANAADAPAYSTMAFMERHLKGGKMTAELLQAQREATVALLKNSRSWRLTAGLRWLARHLASS